MKYNKGVEYFYKVEGRDNNLEKLKESYPMERAVYAMANKLVTDLAFNWWVPHLLTKRDMIVLKEKNHTKEQNRSME
jgi:hypothetical protein